MGRIVFRVLAEVLVIILDQILKDLGEEIIFLLENRVKRVVRDLVNDGTAEAVLLLNLNNMLGDPAEQAYFGLPTGLYRKDLDVVIGNSNERIISFLEMEPFSISICRKASCIFWRYVVEIPSRISFNV